jgi:hypothetical protein
VISLRARPGPLRERFQVLIQLWLRGLEQLASDAVRERHLSAKLDVEQLSFELYALILGANWSRQLFGDQVAIARARTALHRRLGELSTERGKALLRKAERSASVRAKPTEPRGR